MSEDLRALTRMALERRLLDSMATKNDRSKRHGVRAAAAARYALYAAELDRRIVEAASRRHERMMREIG